MESPRSLSPIGSLVGLLTDESTPPRAVPLDTFDAVRILTRVYRWLLYGYSVNDPHDVIARLDAERDLLRLRGQFHHEMFGFEP